MASRQTFLVLALALAVSASDRAGAQGGAAVPFKLGTFEQSGRAFVGMVLRDTQVVDIGRGNAAYEASNSSAPRLTAPTDMKQLIVRYDAEWRQRLQAIAKVVSSAGSPPAYVMPVSALRVLPPVRPSVQLNAGGNYVEHTEGIAA
ncbi:MAG: hypothetical protein FJW14_17900, partial [Acidimicrobiia bacterium]|nr:hypothetical protein [Acidimicrobiia bacterium]